MIVRGFIFSLVAFTAISSATAKTPGITATKSPFESGRGPRDTDSAVADHDHLAPSCFSDATFECSDGFGNICLEKVCDGVVDCHDGSDEDDCEVFSSEPPPSTSLTASADKQCPDDTLYRCDDGRGEICADQRCDGTLDCIDTSDEQNCLNLPPTPSSTQHKRCAGGDSYFVCGDGSAVCVEQVCDSIRDCADGSDENNCGPVPNCPGDSNFKCLDGYGNVCRDQLCNGVEDCYDGSDEHNCGPVPNCPGDSNFKCLDGYGNVCRDQLCNGVEDCYDGSDEHNCDATQTSLVPNPTPPSTSSSKGCLGDSSFVCGDGSAVCVDQVCDMIQDCADGSDENNCVVSTPSSSAASVVSTPSSSAASVVSTPSSSVASGVVFNLMTSSGASLVTSLFGTGVLMFLV